MSSPTRHKISMRKPKSDIPPGFRAMSKPHRQPISQMSLRELLDRHNRNQQILSSPTGSSGSSTAIPRITAEQIEIEARLVEIEGVEGIQRGLKNTHINGEEDMSVDPEQEPYVSPTVLAKRKALANFVAPMVAKNNGHASDFTFQEAVEIERQVFLHEKERQERAEEKRQKQGRTKAGEILTRQEQEARIWAFMNYKPSESDMEDDDDEDSEDEDPSTWFEDDQDDGRKGQNIVDPDMEELADIIRMDESKFHYNTFYEPHDEGE